MDEGGGFHGLEKFGRDDGGLLWSAIAVPWTSILNKLTSSGGGWHVDRLHEIAGLDQTRIDAGHRLQDAKDNGFAMKKVMVCHHSRGVSMQLF